MGLFHDCVFLAKDTAEVFRDIVHDDENVSHAVGDDEIQNLDGVHVFFHLAEVS